MRLINYFYLFTATIIWAFAPALVKLSLADMDSMYFLFARFLIVSLVCLPYLIVLLKKKYSKNDWVNILLYSITGQVSLILYFKGLELTTASDTIIIYLIGPLLTIAAGHYFYREKLNLIKQIGIFVAFIGAIVVVIEPLLSQTNGTATDRFSGNLYVLAATFFGSFWIIHSKFLFGKNSIRFISFMKKFGLNLQKKKYNDVEFNILSFFIAFLCMIPFYIFNFNSYNQTTLNISQLSIWIILYMAIFSSIVAYILYIKAQAKLEVTEVSILGYVSPLFSLPASFLILGEVPTTTAFAGLALILIGVILAESSKYKLK